MRITILVALVIAAILVAAKLWFVPDSREPAASAASPSDVLVTEDSSQGGQVAQAIQKLVSGPPAPEIVSSGWLNSPPLATQDLRGKVVVVEFWTHG